MRFNVCSPLSLHQKTTKAAHSPTAVTLFLSLFSLKRPACTIKYGAVRKFSHLLFCHSVFLPGLIFFTKVLRPLIRYWRLQAIRIVVYLDDGLGVYPTFPDCYSQSMAVKLDLSQAGFVANSFKSIWVPVQSLRWLGYQWDFPTDTKKLLNVSATILACPLCCKLLGRLTFKGYRGGWPSKYKLYSVGCF